MIKPVLKYIITDGGAILFPEEVVHKQVAYGFKAMKLPIYSAGFVKIDGEKIICFGESTSLDIKSKPEVDSIIIKETIFNRINTFKYHLSHIKDFYQ